MSRMGGPQGPCPSMYTAWSVRVAEGTERGRA